ncbi:MAG: ABC transporter ATP-binding protein [Candidatus Heimdallarchaeota archaeon]
MSERDGDLLRVRNLKTYFYTYRGVVKALEGVNFDVGREETMGLVGETGCGKSVTSLSILRLIQYPGKILEGEIFFEDRDLLKLSEEEMRTIRGNQISMIFQEPGVALNPCLRIGFQIAETISIHQDLTIKEAIDPAIEMLRVVGIPDPEKIVKAYPHELSGGMAQRAMIATMLSTKPKLLMADEPTSSLDVTIQAQILRLLKDLIKEVQASVLLITHDLGVVAETCDKVTVMYAGLVAESSDVRSILKNPQHPYTQGLLKALPRPGERGELHTIPGLVPDLVNPPSGCRFHPRCPHAMKKCSKEQPPMFKAKAGHQVACFLYE